MASLTDRMREAADDPLSYPRRELGQLLRAGADELDADCPTEVQSRNYPVTTPMITEGLKAVRILRETMSRAPTDRELVFSILQRVLRSL